MSELRPLEIDERLARALPSGALYAVGGRVRDELRTRFDGEPRVAKDLDYVVTGLELGELVERLGTLGRTDVVGASFAVVKLRVGERTVDVALPRRERSTGPGHREFAVESGPEIPLVDDLARRDFRMNMIARGIPSGEIVDPYGGEADVRARRVDVLRSAAFDEDPLRMLRAAQFAARFEFVLSDATFVAMRAAAPLAATVSAERVRDELVKLLGARTPSLGFEILRETGVLVIVLPELAEGVGIEQNAYHAHDVYRHNLVSLDAVPPGDVVLRLAALLHDVGKPRTKDGPHFYGHEYVGETLVREALTRLRFANDEIDVVAGLVRNHMYATGAELTDGAVRRFIRRVGVAHIARQFALREADIVGSGLARRPGGANEAFQARVAALLVERPALGPRDLAIDGRDVLAALSRAGVGAAANGSAPSRPGSGGRVVGQLLQALLEDVLDRPDLNVRAALLERLNALIAALSSGATGQ